MTDTELADGQIPDAPVTPAADAAPVAPPAPSADADDSGDKSVSPAVQKRFDELTKKWRSQERENMALRAELSRIQQPVQAKAEPVSSDDPVKTLSDFDYDESKFAKYLRDEARAMAKAEAKAAIEQERNAEKAAKTRSDFASKVTEFSKENPDFEDVFHRDLPVSDVMADVIVQSDIGPQLAYHLGKNPEVAARIAQLSPALAARELGRIEARLEFERAQVKSEKPAVSQAPPPPPKLEPVVADVKKDPDEMDDSEWAAFRSKQNAKRMKKNG